MTTPPQKVDDLHGYDDPIRYKGSDGYFYTYEATALFTFGIDEPGTARWELMESVTDTSPKHYVFLSFTPATLES